LILWPFFYQIFGHSIEQTNMQAIGGEFEAEECVVDRLHALIDDQNQHDDIHMTHMSSHHTLSTNTASQQSVLHSPPTPQGSLQPGGPGPPRPERSPTRSYRGNTHSAGRSILYSSNMRVLNDRELKQVARWADTSSRQGARRDTHGQSVPVDTHHLVLPQHLSISDPVSEQVSANAHPAVLIVGLLCALSWFGAIYLRWHWLHDQQVLSSLHLKEDALKQHQELIMFYHKGYQMLIWLAIPLTIVFCMLIACPRVWLRSNRDRPF
jgi:hypothetical protein